MMLICHLKKSPCSSFYLFEFQVPHLQNKHNNSWLQPQSRSESNKTLHMKTPGELSYKKNVHYPKDPTKDLNSHPRLESIICQVNLKYILFMSSLAQNF